MKKFLLFIVTAFLASVVTGIFVIVLLVALNIQSDSIDAIAYYATFPVSLIVYWFFYGKNQLARFRQRRMHEAELGLEKSPIIKKKYMICLGIIVGTLILTFLLSWILDVRTQNTWLALVSLDIIFVTIGVMLFDKAKSLQDSEKHLQIGCFLYFILFAGALGLIISHFLFFVHGFPEA